MVKHIKINEEYLPLAKSFVDQDQLKPEIRANNVYPNGGTIELRQDLVDCEIAICS